jgi:hypothetical protein
MRYSRIAAMILGAWLGGSFLLIYLAANGFESAAAMLNAPPAQLTQTLQAIPPSSQRALLRYVAVEQNRLYFDVWESAQLVLGFALILVLFFGLESRLMSALTLGMMLVVSFQHLLISPELNWLGRSIEFIPWTVQSDPRDQFWRLHTLYIVLDVLQIALGGVVSILLITAQRRRRSRYQEDDDELIEKRLAKAR